MAGVGAPLCCSQRPRVCRAPAGHPPHLLLNRVLGANAPTRLRAPRLLKQAPQSCPTPPTSHSQPAFCRRGEACTEQGSRAQAPHTLRTASVCHSPPTQTEAGAPPPSSLRPHHTGDSGSPPGRATCSWPAVTTEDTGQALPHTWLSSEAAPPSPTAPQAGSAWGKGPGQEMACRTFQDSGARGAGPGWDLLAKHDKAGTPGPSAWPAPLSPLLRDALLRGSSRGT